jgi:hypothetical protein
MDGRKSRPIPSPRNSNARRGSSVLVLIPPLHGEGIFLYKTEGDRLSDRIGMDRPRSHSAVLSERGGTEVVIVLRTEGKCS